MIEEFCFHCSVGSQESWPYCRNPRWPSPEWIQGIIVAFSGIYRRHLQEHLTDIYIVAFPGNSMNLGEQNKISALFWVETVEKKRHFFSERAARPIWTTHNWGLTKPYTAQSQVPRAATICKIWKNTTYPRGDALGLMVTTSWLVVPMVPMVPMAWIFLSHWVSIVVSWIMIIDDYSRTYGI